MSLSVHILALSAHWSVLGSAFMILTGEVNVKARCPQVEHEPRWFLVSCMGDYLPPPSLCTSTLLLLVSSALFLHIPEWGFGEKLVLEYYSPAESTNKKKDLHGGSEGGGSDESVALI